MVIHLVYIGFDAVLQRRFAIPGYGPTYFDRLGVIMFKGGLIGKYRPD
jgi:hypothetical protein